MRRNAFAAAGCVALALLFPAAAQAADTPVTDRSFDRESRVVSDEIRLRELAGAYGREGAVLGTTPGGRATRAVTDRDIDAYTRRLGDELRLRNARDDQDPDGFH